MDTVILGRLVRTVHPVWRRTAVKETKLRSAAHALGFQTPSTEGHCIRVHTHRRNLGRTK